MKTAIEQLPFDFITVLDRELAEKRKADQHESRQRIHDSWLHSAVEDLPPMPEEWNVILMGIRLSRHVHHSECERCKFGPYNHCPDSLGTYWSGTHNQYIPIKICLKDYLKWCARHGLKELAKKQLRNS